MDWAGAGEGEEKKRGGKFPSSSSVPAAFPPQSKVRDNFLLPGLITLIAMPILPDSISASRLPALTGRRHFEGHLTTTLSEQPLVQRAIRVCHEPVYPVPSRRARVPSPARTGPDAPAPRAETVLLKPAFFNAESSRSAASTFIARSTTTRPRDIIPDEADFLYPYGHLERARVPSVEATLAARGGIGVARAGDKTYHRSEWSDRFQDASAKPTKWHQNPNGSPRKLTWAGAGAPDANSGRALWARTS